MSKLAPAFPIVHTAENTIYIGLSQRQYFAAHAPMMDDNFSHGEEKPEYPKVEDRQTAEEWQAMTEEQQTEIVNRNSAARKAYYDKYAAWQLRRIAAWRFAYADAMIAAEKE